MAEKVVVGSESEPLRVAVIGSGPAGFYAALALLMNKDIHTRVDVFDRLPTPYGLVRGGVAPDHQKTKSVIRGFEKAAALPGFRFFGNVTLSKDVLVHELQERYHQIVYAVGNERDRQMHVPGDDLQGISSATAFVGWYNAHPDYREAQFDLSSKRIAVIGNGNVAVDVARILGKTEDELAPTDIADYALAALRENAAQDIVMLGRRGPLQAAFTPTELKELYELPNCGFVVDPKEIDLDVHSRAQHESLPPKAPACRNFDILQNGVARQPHPKRNIHFRFCVSPVEFLGDDSGRVRRVKLEHNELHPDDRGTLRPRGTGRFEEIDVDWVFVSIGYRGEAIEGVPFHDKWGMIPNDEGRVLQEHEGDLRPGEYVVGWAKTGPQGLIGPHKKASAAVVETMLEDLRAGRMLQPTQGDVTALLDERQVPYVSFADWQRIDEAEIERGKTRGAPRVKFSRIAEMLDASKGTAAS